MSVHAMSPSQVNDPVTQAKIDLAAAHRLAVLEHRPQHGDLGLVVLRRQG